MEERTSCQLAVPCRPITSISSVWWMLGVMACPNGTRQSSDRVSTPFQQTRDLKMISCPIYFHSIYLFIQQMSGLFQFTIFTLLDITMPSSLDPDEFESESIIEPFSKSSHSSFEFPVFLSVSTDVASSQSQSQPVFSLTGDTRLPSGPSHFTYALYFSVAWGPTDPTALPYHIGSLLTGQQLS